MAFSQMNMARSLGYISAGVLGLGLCVSPATAGMYATEIQWGGPGAEWHSDANLILTIENRTPVAVGGAATGTNVIWSGPNGNANITFFNDATEFIGTAQFPGEGPVRYRGTLIGASPDPQPYTSEIQWGGPNAPYNPDAPLKLVIENRLPVVPLGGEVARGTSVSWSGADGNGSISFFNDATDFLGSAQFPGEGPVGYRGTR